MNTSFNFFNQKCTFSKHRERQARYIWKYNNGLVSDPKTNILKLNDCTNFIRLV